MFAVNNDFTVSPTHSPKKVWGLTKEQKLILLPSKNKNRLVFDDLRPSFENPKIMPLIPISHPGKAVVLTKIVKQHDHGME